MNQADVAPLAVLGSGMVTSVGLSAAASCAAIRAGLTNPVETRYMDADGEWMMSHAVPLAEPLRGRARLARMAQMAIGECLRNVPPESWARIPLLLCVAEPSRPGRVEGIDDALMDEVGSLLGNELAAAQSRVVPMGRVSAAVALRHARRLLADEDIEAVLVVGSDSFISWPTLEELQERDRLLIGSNSNGFIPGEAAAAVLVGRPTHGPELRIDGLGFATEAAHVDSEQPLRAEGLTQAIRAALTDASCDFHDLDFRVTDLSGEQYYFKEAALAVGRLVRRHKEEFDIWHPAECVGEVGSAIGPLLLAVTDAACRKGYAPGLTVLLHAANDGGERAAIVARYREAR